MDNEKDTASGETKLTPQKAREALDEAIRSLYREFDSGLPRDINERSATHRLAMHLEREIRTRLDGLELKPEDVFADCEYNRDGDIAKGLPVPLKATLAALRTIKDNIPIDVDGQPLGVDDLLVDGRGRTVFPDIIVHKRGKRPGGRNLIVVEAKKSPGATDKSRAADRTKLEGYRKYFGYEHAFFVELKAGVDDTIAAVESI